MFGFLASCGRSLSYRSLYARCCQHQHLRYGKLTLPTLSYESVFLYALGLDAGAAGDYEPLPRTCCRLLGKKDAGVAPDRHIGEFTTALGLLLTSVKLEDDIRDARSWPAWTWKATHHRLLAQPVAKAKAYLAALDPEFEHRLASFASAQADLEADGTADLLRYQQPTADAFGYLFGLMSSLPQLSTRAGLLKDVGEHIGISIVTADCAQDWQHDKRAGLTNPVKSSEPAELAFEVSKEHAGAARLACSSAFGSSSRTVSILSHVEQRIAKHLKARPTACQQPDTTEFQPRAVVLNAVCCVPCGDGAVAVDSKDCDGCFQTLSGLLCCGCCLCVCSGKGC
jgi:hypothetical protein